LAAREGAVRGEILGQRQLPTGRLDRNKAHRAAVPPRPG